MTGLDRRIQEHLQRREFSIASDLIESHLRENPKSADGYYFRGVSAYFQGQIGPTIENLKQALEIDPRHTDAAICLSVLLNDIGKYDEARSAFESANQSVVYSGDPLGIDKKFAIKHLELADLYFRYRRYDEAIEEYAKSALLDPETLDIRIRLSKAYLKKGFLSRAIQELQQLKVAHPRFVPARIQLGLIHYEQKNILDAELEWESVLNIDPRNREAQNYLSLAKESRISL